MGTTNLDVNHKPFLLTKEFKDKRGKYSTDSLDYWLLIWINYYEYLLDHFDEQFILVAFEDLIHTPNTIFEHMCSVLNISAELKSEKKHSPSKYIDLDCEQTLLEKAKLIYDKLDALKKYRV